jgi:hypothetical protein
LKSWLDATDVSEVAASFSRRFWAGRIPILRGQLQQLARLDEINDDTLVGRRLGATCLLEIDDDSERLTVVLGDRELSMPLALEATMAAVLDRPNFRVGDLSEYLDDESRVVVVRRLIREGLLEAIAD